MRNSINTTVYIDDFRPEAFNIFGGYKDRLLVKLNGYQNDGCRDLLTKALVDGDYTIRVSGRQPGHPIICLGWEQKWGGISIAWEEPVTEMIGSFRLNEILCRYAHDTPHFKTEEFLLDGVPHVMRSDGYLLCDGKPILRVMDNNPIPTCLRLAGTASKNYSFTHEIPVRALTGPDMHEINYKDFERMIGNTISIPGMNLKAQFNLVLGIRRWAKKYADLYYIPHLPMTEVEVSKLASHALFEGGADVEYINRMYREVFGLNHDEPLPGLDQDSLNAVSKSQA